MIVELLVQLIVNRCCCSPLHSSHCAVHCTDARIFIAYFIAQSRSKTHAKFIRHLCLHNPSHSPHCKIHHANYAMRTTYATVQATVCTINYAINLQWTVWWIMWCGLKGCVRSYLHICLHSFWHWQCPSYSPSHSDYTRVPSAEATIKGATTTWPREHNTETLVPILS